MKYFVSVFVGIGLCVAGAVQAQDITSDLVGHWSFDDVNGIVVVDSSGNGHDAEVLAGAPEAVPGVNGQAYEFLGIDALHTPNWWGIGGFAGRTIMCWIKSDVIDTHGILGWGLSSGNGQKYHFRINNNANNGESGAIRSEIQGTFNIASVFVADNEWHHVAATFPEDGVFVTEIKHYVDGQLDDVVSTNGNAESIALDTAASPDISDQPFQIGMNVQGTGQRFYTGLIDEVRVYQRELSEEEIRLIYEQDLNSGSSKVNDFMLY